MRHSAHRSARVQSCVQSLEPRCLLTKVGTLSVTVFDDLNNNGKHDKGEPGIPDITVAAYNAGKGDFLGLTPATSNRDGVATFTNENKLTKVDLNIDPSPAFTFGKQSDIPVTLKPGTNQSVDFPLHLDTNSGSVTLRLYRDRGATGHHSVRRAYLGAGELITAYGDKHTASARVTAGGYVHFTGLAHGTYTFNFATIPTDANGHELREIVPTEVTVVAGKSVSVELGARLAPTVSGIAFHDRNGNGKRDAHEPLIRDAYVRVFDPGTTDASSVPLGDDNTFVRTDANGHYVVQLSLYDADYDEASPTHTELAVLANSAERVAPATFTTRPGDDLVRNLPFVRPTTTASITVQTFNDLNDNGILDGDEQIGRLPKALPTVLAQLHRISKHADDRAVAWAHDGMIFQGLLPGTFDVSFPGRDERDRITTHNLDTTLTLAAGESKTILLGIDLDRIVG